MLIQYLTTVAGPAGNFSPESGPVEVPDERAARLIAQRVARAVEAPASPAPSDGDPEPEAPETAEAPQSAERATPPSPRTATGGRRKRS